jgi:3'(2'), 5'-bisphosphate nucleotidase
MNLDLLRRSLIASVRAACARIEAIRLGGIETRQKADASPVTQADEAAEDLLTAVIRALTPAIPIVGEEAFAAGFVPEDCGATFWLIDPLDGTAEFVRGGADYTVNVALVVERVPVLGLLATPRDGVLWSGGPDIGAFRQGADGVEQTIHTRPLADPPVVLASHSHGDPNTEAYIGRLGACRRTNRSSSLKLAVIAEGAADLYPRWGNTSEWDIAAGQAILTGAGGAVVMIPCGEARLGYGKHGFANGPFIAVGDEAAVRARGWLDGLAEL